MTLPSTATTYSVTVPGARLHYERAAPDRWSSHRLADVSANFAPLADALAGDHTVVTYDPRGHAGSTIEDPQEESTPDPAPTTSPRSWTISAPSRPTCSAQAAAR